MVAIAAVFFIPMGVNYVAHIGTNDQAILLN